MNDMLISSDYGLVCGNILIMPHELAKIDGIEIVDNLLVFRGVRFMNTDDRPYIIDQLGIHHQLEDLMEAA